MRLARLRARMLLAVGLPACWSAQTGAPPTVAPVPVAPEPARAAEFDPDRCPIDTLPETVCGQRDEGETRCGKTGDSIASIDESILHVTRYGGRTTFRDFVFDLGATQGFQDRVEPSDHGELETTCCFSRCTQLVVAATTAPVVPPPGWHLDERCVPPPPGGTSVPEATHRACPASLELDGTMRPFASASDESCCYTTVEPDRRVIKGRAIRIDGDAAAAGVNAEAGWRAGSLAPSLAIAPATRARLAAAWLDAARMEHASIAAFSMLALRLLALGAPPQLIERTHAAALDEIEHARLAFELASAYAGAPRGPAPFTDIVRASACTSLAALAVETLLDGCLNETVAALEAELAGESATDPAVAAVLARVAADETRHAELAFAIVAWCVQTDPSVMPALRTALAGAAATPALVGAGDLAAHGVLDAATVAVLRADVLREVVAPCLATIAA